MLTMKGVACGGTCCIEDGTCCACWSPAGCGCEKGADCAAGCACGTSGLGIPGGAAEAEIGVCDMEGPVDRPVESRRYWRMAICSGIEKRSFSFFSGNE